MDYYNIATIKIFSQIGELIEEDEKENNNEIIINMNQNRYRGFGEQYEDFLRKDFLINKIYSYTYD